MKQVGPEKITRGKDYAGYVTQIQEAVMGLKDFQISEDLQMQ